MNKETPLERFLNEDNFHWGIVICCQLIFIGFVCSRALTSIGMVSLLVISLLHNGISESLQKYFQKKEYWILSFFFLIVFLSGIYSDNKSDWLNWVRIKIPYLALPLAFAATKKMEQKKFTFILYGFILTFFISTGAVLGHYFLNYEFINDSFLRGNGIPMPYSHIRYTLMLVFALFSAGYLYSKKDFVWSVNEKWLQLFFIVFAFGAVHFLAVRSALLALYVSLLFVAFRYAIVYKKMLQTAGALICLCLIFFMTIKYVPSLRNKIGFMSYDRAMYEQGQVENLNDGVRILSMKGGLEIAKQNLWLGVGAGDVSGEMEKFNIQEFPQLSKIDRKPIHNQFVWVLAGAGVVGLSFFLFAFFFPFIYNNNYKQWIFAVLHLILFSSFFTEATLEEQMGTGFYLIFLLLFMNHFKEK